MPTETADDSLRSALQALCRRVFGNDAPVQALQRVSGGANMETWTLRHGDRALVLRRTPGGRLLGAEGSFSHTALPLAAQAALIRKAGAAGVRVPQVPAVLSPDDGLGDGFLMSFVAGETLPRRIVGQPGFERAQARLVHDCARELARIHAMAAGDLAPQLPLHTPAEQVAVLARRLQASGAALPVFAWALGWLERHLPPPVPPALLHGDFRFGNFVVDGDGLAAVLDWELAHRGDPVQDLAYLCTPSWRYGRHERVVGGFGDLPDLLQAYARESGRAVDRARFDFWLVYSTLWWGLTCVGMVDIWRDGRDRSLERTVIGRRVSEVEIDLLLLMQDLGEAPVSEPLQAPPPAAAVAAGETGAHELLQALGDWARATADAPGEAYRRFEARVAANALGIAERQARHGGAAAAAQQARLAALDGDAFALAARLRRDGLAPHDRATWDHLRLSTLDRVWIDQPRYAGARIARARWGAHEETP